MDGQLWRLAALGSGLIASTIAGVIIGVTDNLTGWELGPEVYAMWMGLSFVGAAGVGLLVYIAPSWDAARWFQIRHIAELRRDVARFNRETESITHNRPDATGSPTIDGDELAWAKFHVDVAAACRELGGRPTYKGNLDAVLSWSDWRQWAEGLVKAGVIKSIYHGDATEWAEGWNVERLTGKLEGGWAPTHPDLPPPTLKHQG